jgi:ferrous iron transport protein A
MMFSVLFLSLSSGGAHLIRHGSERQSANPLIPANFRRENETRSHLLTRDFEERRFGHRNLKSTLDRLEVGATAKIEEVSTACDRAGRMAVLGFIPGRMVKVTRHAPLGDPISVELDGQEISLRRSEAAIICIREIPK